ncbi:MAG TPA: ABC transporter permease [Bacillales bacterium]|nr:ABC transporter permease [Bacillales bacterium]
MKDLKVEQKPVVESPKPKRELPSFREVSRKYGAVAVLVALVIFNSIVTNNFLDMQTLWNVLLHVSTTVLVSIGMTLVIATGGIDLSVGAIMAIAAVTTTFFLHSSMWMMVLGAVVVAAIIGLLNGTIISYFRIQPIIVTLAMMIAGRGIAQIATDGYLVSFDKPSFETIGKGEIGAIPIPVLIMLITALLFYLVVKYTSFGRYIEAIGDNEKAAQLAGVKVNFVKISVYVIAAVLASFAGIIETSRLAAADATNIGQLIELDAIAAVVVGGTLMTGGRPYIWGTVIGAILMGLITTTFNMNDIPHSYSLVLKAAIIIVAVYLQRGNQA